MTSTDMIRSPDGGLTDMLISTDGYMSLSGRIGFKICDQLTAAVSGTNLNRRIIGVSPYPAVEGQALATLTGRF